jgi:hypothetical protein
MKVSFSRSPEFIAEVLKAWGGRGWEMQEPKQLKNLLIPADELAPLAVREQLLRMNVELGILVLQPVTATLGASHVDFV